MAIPQTGQGHMAAPETGDGSAGVFVGGQMYFPGGASIASGNGVPGDNFNGAPPVIGDIWIRVDGGVGSTLYRCTTAGPGAIWGAIL